MAFDFIQPPSVSAMKAAMQQLLLLGALHRSDGQLTDFGRNMASLPLEPMYAKLLLDADNFGCVAEVRLQAQPQAVWRSVSRRWRWNF